MTTYVLVAGAWLGAWAWRDVTPALEAAGHDVRATPLGGLGERAGEPATQRSHVDDVVAAAAGAPDVVLVGHSYSGLPVGQAAVRLGEQVRRVVLVDANVPVEGENFLGSWADVDEFRADLDANDGFWNPLPAEAFYDQGLSEDDIAEIQRRATPQPGATLLDPAELPTPLGDLTGTYVSCLLDARGIIPPTAAELLTHPSWTLVELDTGHWPMFSAPDDLSRILLDA